MSVRDFLKSAINHVVNISNVSDHVLARLDKQPAWIILGYHRVIESAEADPLNMGMCTRNHDFDAHMRYISESFPVLSINDGLQRLRDKIPGLFFSVSMDDGYADNLNTALPIMQKFSIPASVYVTTSGLDSAELFWWDRVITAIHSSPLPLFETAGLGLNSLQTVTSLSATVKRSVAKKILADLWAMPYQQAVSCIAELELRLQGQSDPLGAQRMTPQQLKVLSAAGVSIEAHTRSHQGLNAMPLKDAVADVIGSQQDLQKILGHMPKGFAYPDGRNSAALADALASAGFDYALTTDRGINSPEAQTMSLKRMLLADSDLYDFKRCLAQLAWQHLRHQGG